VSWIDEDMAELRRQRQSEAELRARHSTISECSCVIFNDLWKELLAGIREAEEKALGRLLTNGSPYERTIIVPVKPQPPQTVREPDVYEIRLTQDQQGITVKGPKTSFLLSLDLSEDDKVVRIRHEGEYKDPKEAAKLILRPMIFPDLFGPK
jgi:hypothetical protein